MDRRLVAMLQLALRQIEGHGVAFVASVVMENDPESGESDNTSLQIARSVQCHA